jgi:hydrogenase-4 membrane subunit HyfE
VITAVLAIPLAAAALLALLPGHRLTARINAVASGLTLLAALSLLLTAWPAPGRYLLIDDLNIVFVVLNTFVGFTTAVFSASYIGHELATGRLTSRHLRFYHAMYQLLMFAMNLALVALAMVVMLKVTADAHPLARQDLAFALAVVLLGLLLMVTRRNAVSQVVGFMALENGLVLAATGAKGMPLVVEISVAFSILIAFIVIGIFLFRIRERFDTVDVQALDRFRGERQ